MKDGPNILWITLESVRADHTPMYGYERDTTPNIAAESRRPDATVFSTALSQSMWTPASTGSILTGTYLSTHRLGQDGKAKRKLRSDLDTLPQLLSNRGYETVLFTPNAYISSATGLDEGFSAVYDLVVEKPDFLPTSPAFVDNWRCALRRLLEQDGFEPEHVKNDVRHNSTATVPGRFRRWERNERTADRPFFAYAHLNSPHHPYLPVNKYRDQYATKIDISIDEAVSLVKDVYAGSDAIKRRMARGLDLGPVEWGAIRALYDAEIRFADEVAGDLIESARSISDRNLIVVVTADHGDLFGEYGLIGHNLALHDGLIIVPLVVTGIDGLVDGPDVITQHVDVSATIASITDTITDQFAGRDLRDGCRPFGISQRGIAHIDAYAEYNPGFDVPGIEQEPMTAVGTPEFKFVHSEATQYLYNLPDETNDVSDDKPNEIDRLSTILDRKGISWQMETDSAKSAFDKTTRQRLRDLGYIA